MVQRLPIGIQNFSELREGSFYYVDKSDLISQILDANGKVHLFTRPRRFGKSLSLSMLDCYFNIKYKGVAEKWFEDLSINKRRPDDLEMNSYPVIYLDFKNLRTDYDGFIEDLRIRISSLFLVHLDQVEDERIPSQRETFMSILDKRSSVGELRNSLQFLCDMLYRRFDRPVVVLIDEYDSPINNSNGSPDQRMILDFMKGILSEVLKNGNTSLRFGIVTGVMQVSKESIFSGLNNLKVNNIFSKQFDEMFGFTPDEVRRICTDYGHPEKYEDAREWYDGYRFGDADIYNPWSVISYVDNGFEAGPYWTGTSGNSIIADLLRRGDSRTFGILKELSDGGSVIMTIDSRVTFEDLDSRSGAIFSVMAMSGYLTAVPTGDGQKSYSISIPNREIYDEYRNIISQCLDDTGDRMSELLDVLTSGDASRLSDALEDLLMSDMSFRILDDESAYQAYMVGLFFHFQHLFTISAEREAGKGYCDIIMVSKKGDVPSIVLELKHRKKDGSELDRLAAEAVEQIHYREYYHGLKGRVLLYGLAFHGKDARVVSEELEL